jgi:hypothetical protein
MNNNDKITCIQIALFFVIFAVLIALKIHGLI